MFKSSGEVKLARLARASFLRPWTFPNLYFRKGKQSKELADLVVRYGDALIIVSDKERAFNFSIDPEIAWEKWKSIISDSKKQLSGAERQLAELKPKLFLDAACQRPAPTQLFDAPAKHIYRIAVVRGSGTATQHFYQSKTRSLAISSEVSGDWPGMPFCYNPTDSTGRIYHVLDDYTFGILFAFIDTAPDLLSYLEKKEKLLKSFQSFFCHGEEELIQHYLKNLDDDGEHGFGAFRARADEVGADHIFYAEDTFAEFSTRKELATKKIDDGPSYFVDQFIDHMYTTVEMNEPKVEARVEQALRQLASLNRVARRILGAHLVEVSEARPKGPIYVRTHFSGESVEDADTATLMLLFDIRADFHPDALSFSEIREFADQVTKCYVAKIAVKGQSIQQFSIILFFRDSRGESVLFSQGVAYVPRSIVDDEFLAEYLPLADSLKLGDFSGPIHQVTEKEYRD